MERSPIINISLLDITGPLDEETPLIVLQEIAETHGVSLHPAVLTGNSYIIRNIKSLVKPFIFHRPLLVQELPQVSAFVNKKAAWPADKLQQALDFIVFFASHPGFPPDGNVFYGYPTPSHPSSFTACMLYRLLKDRRLKIHRHCSLQQLGTAVMFAFRTPEQTRALLYSSLISCTSDQLSTLYSSYVNIINPPPVNLTKYLQRTYNLPNIPEFDIVGSSSSDQEEEPSDVDDYVVPYFFPQGQLSSTTYQSLQDSAILFGDQEYLMKRMVPCSLPEAISLAAIIYEIDISQARNPIAEYFRVSENPTAYKPLDGRMLSMYENNPYIFRLDIYFNPFLPPELYDEDTLHLLANLEGYNGLDFMAEGVYSLLQTAHYGETFHPGKHLMMSNQQTLEYDDIIDIDSNLIVCYGAIECGVYAFTYEELSQFFRKERCFKNPSSGVLFTPVSIRKLKNICKLVFPGEMPCCFARRSELLNAIGYVEVLNDAAYVKIKELHEVYEESEEPMKDNIRIIITMLMDLGMYMRGWNGRDAYPVENCPVENQSEVDVNVTGAIARLEAICTKEELFPIGLIIFSLPLLKFFNGGYIVSNNDNEGITVGARIQIVKQGEDIEPSYSCIRMSSNWICATAYRVMTVLGMIPSFQIQNLRSIS